MLIAFILRSYFETTSRTYSDLSNNKSLCSTATTKLEVFGVRIFANLSIAHLNELKSFLKEASNA